MQMIKEEFRDIPGFEGIYQVSNLGNVKSLPRKILNGKAFYISKERILKPSICSKGYYFFVLKKPKAIRVHKLVAMAFLNHIPDGTHKIVVDHINNIRTDNRLENLQLITNRENCSKDKKNGSSKYTGVYWSKERNKWKSKININGKSIHLGYFKIETEASEYYQNALKSIENNEEIVIKKRIFSSNYKGVRLHKHSNKWIAAIKINKKQKHIGCFKTEIEAHNAYQNKLSEINSKLNII